MSDHAEALIHKSYELVDMRRHPIPLTGLDKKVDEGSFEQIQRGIRSGMHKNNIYFYGVVRDIAEMSPQNGELLINPNCVNGNLYFNHRFTSKDGLSENWFIIPIGPNINI